ncbi:MAG: pilus assembly protein TadG-related protein [Hyphomicrobiaceae bacterium]
MSTTKAGTLKSFQKSEDGTIAIIFALTCFVVIMITALAIDVGRIYHAERKLASAIDAAVLAAAKSMRENGLDDAEVQALATKYFQANVQGGGNYAKIKTVSVAVDRRVNSVTMDVEGDVQTYFAGIAGFHKVSIPKQSVALYDSKDIEVGLQLDVTGSMCDPCRKMQDLKDAVAGDDGLLDILLPTGGTTNNVRIGLAPFAAGVNAGDYALAVSNGRATNGCVYERRNLADQATEAPALGALALKAKADLPRANPCPTNARVQAMTDNKTMLRDEINSWNPNGATAGHLGAAWAWYLVSPEWSAIWPAASRPAPYADGKTMKVVILMTDGEYNTVGGVSSSQSTRYAKETCDAMKAQGVIVYTVGFEAPNSAKAALRDCASGDAKFFDARDGDALRNSFRAIAAEINSLRLTK